jgi:tetraacyldisaccharide 4'-kinase
VDAVITNGGDADDIPGPRRFAMHLAGEEFVSLAGGQRATPAEFAAMARGRDVTAIAGIGHPARFFEHLARMGVAARSLAFPDHHGYQPQDLKLRGTELIVMTEKDAVKCAAFADARMWFLRVDARLSPEFGQFLLERITAARRRPDGSQAR